MAKFKRIKPKYENQLLQYQAKLAEIQEATEVDSSEGLAVRNARKARVLDSYTEFALHYFPHYCTGRPAWFHVKLAQELSTKKKAKLVRKWARSMAKSTNCAIIIPIWLMLRGELKFMVLASATEDSAIGLLGDLQAELEGNQRLIHDFGEFQKLGAWELGDFRTKHGVRFKAIGRRQSPRGLRSKQHRPDYILCDDLDDDELVKNPKLVSLAYKWAMSALFGSFSVKGGRFLFVGNLISKTSILQMACDNKKFETEQVDLIDEQGNPSWDYYSLDECNDMIDTMGYVMSQREYFHNPIEQGTVYKSEYFQYKKRLPFKDYEAIVCYTDPSFKSGTKNDFKATVLIGKWRHEYHLLLCRLEQTTVTKMVDWHYEIMDYIKGEGNVDYYMEANFIQDMLLQNFDDEAKKRGLAVPIRGDKRAKPDKYGRIESMSPIFEKGYFFISVTQKECPHVERLIGQFCSMEKGSKTPDDGPDAVEGAIHILNQKTKSNQMPIVIQRNNSSSKYRY